MRETDDWALWFRELAQKIANGGEQYLIDKSKEVAWQDDDGESSSEPFGLLRYGDENIDPLSFFYTLASRSGRGEGRQRIFSSIAKAFGMTREPAFDHRFIFPHTSSHQYSLSQGWRRRSPFDLEPFPGGRARNRIGHA